jgi:acyl-coenzyme A thioesterase PaaI-like protein
MRRELADPSEETLARIQAIAADSPMATWFGLIPTLEDGRHLYRLSFAEPHIGNPVIRALHGGVISAFLEYTARLEILSRHPRDVSARSISVHTSYLRGSRDQDLNVAVEVQRTGRRIAFVEARGWQSEPSALVASAQIALRLFEPDGA